MMRASFLLAIVALACSSSAQNPTYGFDTISSPANQTSYKVGSSLPIVWAPESVDGTVTIVLNGGSSPNSLSPVLTVACTSPNQIPHEIRLQQSP